MDDELTCGQELAASSEVPRAIGALLGHVAINLRAHAEWVGSASAAARAEQDAMLRVAQEYEALGAAAQRAAALMRSCAGLEPAPHDPAKLDRAALASWMRAKIGLQRGLADLLLAHAVASERALDALGV